MKFWIILTSFVVKIIKRKGVSQGRQEMLEKDQRMHTGPIQHIN